jgi:hypothetical protein
VKPERLLLGFVALVWLAGIVVWITHDGPGVPTASIGLWLAAFGLACVPFVLALVDRLIGVFRRGRH